MNSYKGCTLPLVYMDEFAFDMTQCEYFLIPMALVPLRVTKTEILDLS